MPGLSENRILNAQELQQSLFCCSSTDALFCCLAQVLRIYFLSAFTAELASFLQFMPAFLTEKRIIRVNKHNCFLPLQHYHILARIASQFFLFPQKNNGNYNMKKWYLLPGHRITIKNPALYSVSA